MYSSVCETDTQITCMFIFYEPSISILGICVCGIFLPWSQVGGNVLCLFVGVVCFLHSFPLSNKGGMLEYFPLGKL